VPFLLAERAHSESARPTRAVKGNLDHSLEQRFGAKEEMEPDDLLCSRNARPRKDGKGSLVVLLLAERAQSRIDQATLENEMSGLG
jgi:hypothetical protein